MDKTTENTQKLLKFVADKFESGELNNDSLMQLIELAGDYLNLCTIQQYADRFEKSYNGVKNHRNIIKLFGVKLVLDNH